MVCEVGVVVAGGRSERFGQRDKALAQVDDLPMLRRVAEALAHVADQLVVNCRDDQQEGFTAALEGLSIPVRVVEDVVPDRGPVAGLHDTLLALAGTERVVVCSCDLPFVTDTVFERLLATMDVDPTLEAVVARGTDGGPMPLCGVYTRVPTLGAIDGDVGIPARAVLDRLEHEVIDATDGQEPTLVDVNTVTDWRRVRARSTGQLVGGP